MGANMSKETSKRYAEMLSTYQAGVGPSVAWARRVVGHFDILSWKWGEAQVRWTPDEKHLLPDGVMFGGHLAAVADHMGFVGVATVMTDDNEGFRTTQLQTNYFRPVTAAPTLINIRVGNMARTLIHVDVDIMTPDDKLAVRSLVIQNRIPGAAL